MRIFLWNSSNEIYTSSISHNPSMKKYTWCSERTTVNHLIFFRQMDGGTLCNKGFCRILPRTRHQSDLVTWHQRCHGNSWSFSLLSNLWQLSTQEQHLIVLIVPAQVGFTSRYWLHCHSNSRVSRTKLEHLRLQVRSF